MTKKSRTIGTIIKWSLSIDVVALPFTLLFIEKTITLDRVSQFIIPYLSIVLNPV